MCNIPNSELGISFCIFFQLGLTSGVIFAVNVSESLVSGYSLITWVKRHLAFFFPRHNGPHWAKASSLSMFHDRTELYTPHSVRLLWTSDRPDADLYLTTRDTHKRYSCRRWDSNPQSQQASGRRPTP
jgi:hypothetical protein